MERKKKTPIKVVNIMKDGRRLDSLEGIDAPEEIYDILLRDYRAKGITLVPVEESGVEHKSGKE